MSLASSSRFTACVLGSFALVACIETSSEPAGRGGDARAEDANDHEAPAVSTKPHFVSAEPGELKGVVQRAVQAAHADGCTLLVYVGATWCEPCVAFHHAVE